MAIYTQDSLASTKCIKGREPREDKLQERYGKECWNVRHIRIKLEE